MDEIRAETPSVSLEPFKVREAVQVEVDNRLETVVVLLDEILDWAHSTKHLGEPDTEALLGVRNTVTEVVNNFHDRTNAATPTGPPSVGRG